MNYFERYQAANMPYGDNISDHIINASKRSALRSFLSSTTLSNVQVNDGDFVKSLVSVYSGDFFDRTFLFEPESKHAKVGNYIKFKDYTYLTMKSNDNEIYPNLKGKLCNEDFKLPIGIVKRKVSTPRGGYTYVNEEETINIPIVVDVKGYSVSDNAVLPLPVGRVNMYLGYSPKYMEHLSINYEFELFQNTYKITDIQTDNIINEVGYLAVSAQKVVDNDAN